jgi:hypothetical protein
VVSLTKGLNGMLYGLHSFISLEVVMHEMLLFVADICQLTLEKGLCLFELNCVLLAGFGLFIELDHFLKVINDVGMKGDGS